MEVQKAIDLLSSDYGELPERSAEKEAAGVPSFLVGFPRSGTTLLDQILDNHPGIQVMDERPIFDTISHTITKDFDDFAAAFSALGQKELRENRELYFQLVDQYLARRPGTLLIDKLPLNIRHVPLILRLFPSAKFILVLRHPCDVVLSNFMQRYKLNEAMANFFTLADAAHCYARVMYLWQKCAAQLPMTYHTVRYESLVTDFETEVRSLLEFLEVGWDEAVLGYATRAREKAIINTPSYQAVTEPINTRAKFRWVRYREQMKPILDDLAPFVEAFGYAEMSAEEEVT